MRGTYPEQPENRHAVDVAKQILTGAACLYRLQSLKVNGLQFPAHFAHFRPE